MIDENYTPDYDVVYTIPLPYGLTLFARRSANAWWMDKKKVEKLIYALSIDATVKIACHHAGITARQYKYFLKLHPEFREAKDGYRAALMLIALRNIAKAINEGDVRVSRWFLAWKYPEEYGTLWGRYKKAYQNKYKP